MEKYYGKGYTINAKWSDNPRLYSIWHGMISRCYNDSHIRKSSYQDRGVFVSEEWLCLDNFIKDVKEIQGWDENLFERKLIELDKDFKGGKSYSKTNCQWILKEKNNSFQPSHMKKFVAINPEGEKIAYNSQNKCAKDNNLDAGNINKCLKGSRNSHKGWSFYYL